MSDRITIKPVTRKKNGKFITTYKVLVGEKELSYIADTEDVALLIGLSYKYDGPNSRFTTMACRMLQIESVWAE
jgi:hypothetical protein